MKYVRFIAAFLIYLIIDVGWNLSPIATGMYESLHESSGHAALLDAYGRQMDTWGAAVYLGGLAFFLLIAFGNSYLAIEPALKEGSLLRAVKNSFTLGCAAYATYIVPFYMMISTVPAILIPIDILIGGLLSLITSTVVTAAFILFHRSGD